MEIAGVQKGAGDSPDMQGLAESTYCSRTQDQGHVGEPAG
jgi:hypothetical protein